MLQIRKASDRGHADHGWLDTWHTFSFADYYDEAHMGFRALRVINEDFVAPGKGFPTHGHRDMEILTYVLEGGVRHRDSMDNGSVIRPGNVQRMSAGTGVMHSEFNASDHERLHLLQIWILPERRGLAPSYEEKVFPEAEKRGRLRLLAARDARQGAVTIHADVNVHGGCFAQGEAAVLPLAPARHAWVQVARGAVRVQGHALTAGDGIALSDETQVRIEGAGPDGEVLVFDLA